jgi:ribosomal protein S18 acetylase RimI-like enzyme
LAERQPSKLNVASSNLVSRSNTVRFAVEDPGSDDAQWCVQQYFAELNARFNTGFDPALSISADSAELTPPAGLLLIARADGRPIGCGALKFHPGAPAELKRMWVAPDARGLGLGRRLLTELEDHARVAGVETLHLETNESLAEAIALYRRSGFTEVPAFNDEPYADHWFEKQLALTTRSNAGSP